MGSESELKPAWRQIFSRRPLLAAILSNSSWLVAERALRLAFGTLIAVWLARYLGPERFGTLSFAMAFVAIFGAFAAAGMQGVLVRELVLDPGRSGYLLGTALTVRVATGCLAFLGAIATVSIFWRQDSLTVYLVFILATVLVFQASEIVKFWFESQMQSRYAVLVEGGAFLLIAASTLTAIFAQASLSTFATLAAVESALVAFGLLVVYRWSESSSGGWKFRKFIAAKLMRESWPLMLSSLTVMLYMRIDQVMLAAMAGDRAVGLYSMAVRISEVWYFVPTAIVASAFPTLLRARRDKPADYERGMGLLYKWLTAGAIVISCVLVLTSDWTVRMLLGASYAESASILIVHAWSGVFVCLGVVSGRWYLAEGLQHLAFYRTAVGAVVNVVLNVLLIPQYGAIGAAVATLISYSVAAFWFDAFDRRTRAVFWVKANALVMRDIFFPNVKSP